MRQEGHVSSQVNINHCSIYLGDLSPELRVQYISKHFHGGVVVA
jgi:hypothetical protein